MALNNKIDFMAIVTVEDANPNGDPLNGNRPRQHYDNTGFMTPVCIKRKLRNRLQDMGRKVLIQQNDRSEDGLKSISARLDMIDEIADVKNKKVSKGEKIDKNEIIARKTCEVFEDVRAFGATIALKNKKDSKEAGISVGVRGPVTIQQAESVGAVDIESIQITKSTNSAEDEAKGSDTMGWQHVVRFGTYVIKGSINPILAAKTGFSDQDAADIKEALRTLFENDESAARPSGSMNVIRLYWWEQKADEIRYSTSRVLDTVHVEPVDPEKPAESFDDFRITENDLPDVKPEVIEGF